MDYSSLLPKIRIRKIILTDFRNILHSEINIPGGKMSEFLANEPSILGLYGQNGSGKTSVLMAIYALKTALSGSEFELEEFSSCIRHGCNSAKLDFEFSAYTDKGIEYDLYYSFSMAIREDEDETPTKRSNAATKREFLHHTTGTPKIVIFNEILQYAAKSPNDKRNKQILIDTSDEACAQSGKVFGNKKKYEQLTENLESNIDILLEKSKMKANIQSTSFIFSSRVNKLLIEGACVLSYKIILKALAEYGKNYLFVILTNKGHLNNTMTLSVCEYESDSRPTVSQFLLNLYSSNEDFEEDLSIIKKSINAINQVISQIVPSLTIVIDNVRKWMVVDNQILYKYDLFSKRNGIQLPLAYESDGIQRMISFLSLIIAVYNNPSVTVAIDEIDAGIFEYLLGELLTIIKDSAKGQLIFTSHNLRPLEVLPYKNLLFTTVNPENRFARLDGISGNNNLRDSYFRSIILGDGKDAFYDATDTFNIEQSLLEAGYDRED